MPAIINPLLESSDLTEAETQEAQKIKAQLDHTCLLRMVRTVNRSD